MPSNSNRNQGCRRGDSWHIPHSQPAADQQAASSLEDRFDRLSVARYQHDAGHDGSSRGRAPHPPHHHSERDEDAPVLSPGAALAARITLPASHMASRYPANGNMQTTVPSQRTRHNEHSKHNNCKYCQRGGRRNSYAQPPLSATEPILGFQSSYDMPWEQYAGFYKTAITLRNSASEYMKSEYADVFNWWYHRIIDRLGRKEDGNIELDFHEKVLHQLHQWAFAPGANQDHGLNAILNYYAEQMVPKAGFLVKHVETARGDPLRWERRDQREEEFNEMDPSGDMLSAYHAKAKERADNSWKSWEDHLKHCPKRRNN